MPRHTLLLIGVIAAIGVALWWGRASNDAKKAADRERREIESSITDIPHDLHRQWLVDLDRRIDEMFVAGDGRIIVVRDTFNIANGVKDYPAAQVSYHCDSLLGVRVKFGAGPEVDSVALFWTFGADSPFGEGVGKDSPAVHDLMRDMCARLRERLSGE